jgi:hypothetical protein
MKNKTIITNTLTTVLLISVVLIFVYVYLQAQKTSKRSSDEVTKRAIADLTVGASKESVIDTYGKPDFIDKVGWFWYCLEPNPNSYTMRDFIVVSFSPSGEVEGVERIGTIHLNPSPQNPLYKRTEKMRRP